MTKTLQQYNGIIQEVTQFVWYYRTNT
jgi:hypothetical protein